jgi:predicted RNA-binding protein Jag
MSDQKTAEIEAEIEEQREHLADTVDQLAHKMDVKAQAKERAEDLKSKMTNAEGKPRPVVYAAIAGVLATTGLLVWWRRR